MSKDSGRPMVVLGTSAGLAVDTPSQDGVPAERGTDYQTHRLLEEILSTMQQIRELLIAAIS